MTTKNLYLDPGNYSINWAFDSDIPQTIRSQRYNLVPGQSSLKADKLNPLVELGDGSRYHYGRVVTKYRSQEVTALTKKEESLLDTVRAVCGVQNGDTSYTVNVIASHPTPELLERQEPLKAGQVLSYIHNGIQMKVKLGKVSYYQEGLGSYQWAKSKGKVGALGHTVVLDIGGGTVISLLLDSDGEILSRKVSPQGVVELATAIADDSRLSEALGTEAKIGQVMDALANGGLYGAKQTPISEYASDHIKPWFRSILLKLNNEYKPYFADIGGFLLTGGGYHLVSNWVSELPGFKPCPDVVFGNLLGMRGSK